MNVMLRASYSTRKCSSRQTSPPPFAYYHFFDMRKHRAARTRSLASQNAPMPVSTFDFEQKLRRLQHQQTAAAAVYILRPLLCCYNNTFSFAWLVGRLLWLADLCSCRAWPSSAWQRILSSVSMTFRRTLAQVRGSYLLH